MRLPASADLHSSTRTIARNAIKPRINVEQALLPRGQSTNQEPHVDFQVPVLISPANSFVVLL